MAEQLDPQQEPIPVATTFLDLPPNALQHIALFLPDPGPLAATCRTTAAQLDEDALLLAWAGVWLPNCTEPQEGRDHRHPGYALLHWRRLYCMDMQRLATLLLRWAASQAPWAAEDSNAQQQAQEQAQQQLERGEPVAALRALLPHSAHLLLLYAAQAGHVQLLRALLAAPEVSTTAQLQWDADRQAACNLLLPALAAAAHGGHAAAVQLLLEAMEIRGELTSLADDQLWRLRVLGTAVQGGARSVACLQLLLSKLGYRDSQLNEDRLLELAARGGCTPVVEVLLGYDRSHSRAVFDAVLCGQRHLLPLLMPASTSHDHACSYWQIASAVGPHNRTTPPWGELVEAFWAIGSGPGASKSRCQAVAVAVDCNSVRALNTMWAEAKQLPPEEQALLALAMLQRLSWSLELETVRWVFLFALPVLQRNTQPQHHEAIGAAMRKVLSSGLHDLRPQPPLGRGNDQDWLYAKQQGQLMLAVRQGNPYAVQQALLGFQPLGQQALLGLGGLGQPGVVRAVLLAATVLGPAEAEAVARVLLPALDAGGNNQGMVADFLREVNTGQLFRLPHGGRVLRLAVEVSRELRAAVIGAHARANRLLHQACSAGLLDIAEWLVMQPEQRHDYLSGLFILTLAHRARERFESAQWWRAFAALLHRLAAAAPGAAEEADPGAAGAAGAATASVHGDDGAGAVAGAAANAAAQPPAGARVLEPWLLQAVLRSGMPDALHALLVYMDVWKRHAGN